MASHPEPPPGTSPDPWSLAAVPALITVAALSAALLCYGDQPYGTPFLLFNILAAVALTLGFPGSLAALGARATGATRQLPVISAAVGAAWFVLVLGWSFRAVQAAQLSNRYAAAAVGAALAGGALVGLLCWLVGRSGFRLPAAWAVAPAALLGVAALFATRDAGPRPDVAPISAVPAPAARALPPDTNLLLITIDTLRADHLDAYGYPRETAPTLRALAKRGVLFERAVTQRGTTAPSLATLLTGTYPPTHRVFNNGDMLQDFNLTAAEMLRTHGFSTRAVISNPSLTSDFNFSQGFDALQHSDMIYYVRFDESSESRELNELILPALREMAASRFFLWVHYRDPHSPYLVPESHKDLFTSDALSSRHGHLEVPIGSKGMRKEDVVYGSQDLDFLVAQYDAEIRFNDESIAELFATMDELGLWKNTLVVVTADHGESLSEHGEYFKHGGDAHEPVAHVPLIFVHPDPPAGLRVADTVSLVDVLPTVLDLMGLETPPTVQGSSFAQLLRGEQQPYRPNHFNLASWRWGYQSHAVTTNQYKLVFDVDERLLPVDVLVDLSAAAWRGESAHPYRLRRTLRSFYDLSIDPEELNDIAGTGVAAESDLSAELWQWIDATYGRGDYATRTGDMDQKTKDALRALGYVVD
jgi:arylsulfatase A-like enzyme